MKKLIAAFLALCLACSMAACAGGTTSESSTASTSSTSSESSVAEESVASEEPSSSDVSEASSEGSDTAEATVLSHEEYMAAELDTEVTIQAYVQAKQSYYAEQGTDELEQHQNEKVSFTGLTVAPSTDANGNEAAFLYNYDGSGTQGDDVYFNVSYNGQTYSFVVESYLCGSDTEVYKAVEALEVGQTIDCEGFLYWYEGANPHITSVTVAA